MRAPASRLWLMCLACLWFVADIARGESYPYVALVVTGEADVRSGPDLAHYVTDRVLMGTEVEVHRLDPGGWLAIRPPATSYCWVPANKLRMTDRSNVAEVVADDAVAWMGSSIEQVRRHRWQVRLERGEEVAILGRDARNDSDSGAPRTWFRIAAPSGEFRWIHQDDVRRAPPGRGASEPQKMARVNREPANPPARAATARPPLTVLPAANSAHGSVSAPAARTERVVADEAVAPVAAPAIAPVAAVVPPSAPATSSEWVSARKHTEAAQLDHAASQAVAPALFTTSADANTAQSANTSPNEQPGLTILPTVGTDALPASPARPPAPAVAPAAGSASTLANSNRGEPRVVWAPRSPRREAQQLDQGAAGPAAPAAVVASANPLPTLNQPNNQPNPAPGVGRSESQLERDDIELQLSLMVSRDPQLWNLPALRGRAEALVERGQTPLERGQARLLLEQIAEFEDLYERHVQAERGIVVPTANVARDPAMTGRAGAARVEPRFDGSGWLVPVHSTRKAAPPYALSDEAGKVVLYVTPAPGVNLHRYERKRVGIYGQRNSTPSLSAQVLTAHRIVDLGRE